MNLSLFTLILNHLNLLPFLQQDITTELKVISSSEDGVSKIKQTIAVMRDLLNQAEAAVNNSAIPATTATPPAK